MVSMVGCDEMVEIPHVVTLQPCQAKVLVVGGSMAIGNFNRTTSTMVLDKISIPDVSMKIWMRFMRSLTHPDLRIYEQLIFMFLIGLGN